MEQVVLPGHLFDHCYSTWSRRESCGLTEQTPSSTLAPEPPQVLGLVPVPVSVGTEIQVSMSESSVPVQPCPECTPALPSCCCPPAPGSPLFIHGYTVEDYQDIYHSIVDPMLTYPKGRPRPYSLDLGRRIKQRLWKKLERPLLRETETTGGLLHYVESQSSSPYPPLTDVDVSKEPPPPKLSLPFVFQAQPTISAGGPNQPQRHLLREQAAVCAEPASRRSHRLALKRKKTSGSQSVAAELADQTTSSSPVPEREEPNSKRLCHPEPKHTRAPLSSRSILLRFRQQNTRTRKLRYPVEDASEQVSPSSSQTSTPPPDFLMALGLAPTPPQ